jgi:hypothetical protein
MPDPAAGFVEATAFLRVAGAGARLKRGPERIRASLSCQARRCCTEVGS